MNRSSRFLILLATSTCLASPALAQVLTPQPSGYTPDSQQDAPVSFSADKLSYDKSANTITALGHVIVVQNGHILHADKVIINRKTNIVIASGHVSLTQPHGETVYTDHITLSDNMKNAVMTGVAARMADNVRVIANGGRRYNGQIDELSKPVYSACDLCKNDPRSAPIWSIRATSATRDLQHKMIEFRNATLLMKGFPVFWFPYLSETDPSVKRQTGLLIPSAGSTSQLGAFAILPYFITLGPSAGLTLAPVLATKQGPGLKANYQQAFNRGVLDVKLSAGKDRGHVGNSIFANSSIDLNKYWRGGFSYNHTSDANYLNDYNILPSASYLQSSVYLEGFSDGSYAQINAQSYQGLVASVTQSKLPIVKPYSQYAFTSQPDEWLGGTFKIDSSFFNITRTVGTNTRRLSLVSSYEVPFMLPGGIVGTSLLQLDSAYYNADKLNQQPNYSINPRASTVRAQPYGAVKLRWPFLRPTQTWGDQLIEPIVQLVTSPVTGTSRNNEIPNEDSLDLEFSDANLFSLNRYPGIDRLEGGSRVDYALHTAWYLPNGMTLDGLIGQSYRAHKDRVYLPESGLNDNASDIVDRFVVAPVPWFNVSYRGRMSHKNFGNRMTDVTSNFGNHTFSISTGYLYTNTNPYALYDNTSQGQVINFSPPSSYFQPRKEITTSFTANISNWSFSGGAQRNLETAKLDEVNASAGWQNNCFGVSLIFNKRYTSFNLDNGSTLVLVQFDFKTLGTVGFNTL